MRGLLTRDVSRWRSFGQSRRPLSTKWEPWADHYTGKAVKEGMRARSAFKLVELSKSLALFRKHSNVVDIGAAPGGWTLATLKDVETDPSSKWQYADEMLRRKELDQEPSRSKKYGQILAIDLLEMAPISGVTFLRHDALDPGLPAMVHDLMEGGRFVDIVLSDMAPNTSGDRQVDHFRSMELVDAALNVAFTTLRADGAFLSKYFRGQDEPNLLKKLKSRFRKVKTLKPSVSRSASNEMYVFGRGFKKH